MQNKFRKLLFGIWALAVIAASAALSFRASAQDGAWGEVLNADGTINYGELTDNGVITRSESFMPTLPLVGQLNAEYHVYTTQSGNQVLMPSLTTLFFMSSDSSSLMYSNPSLGTSGLGVASASDGSSMNGAAFLGKLYGLLNGSADASDLGGTTYSPDFFSDTLSGAQNLFELGPSGMLNFLHSLASPSLSDMNLYTYMILLSPDACASSPTGCAPPEDLTLETPPPTVVPTDAPPDPLDCPAPVVISGRISFDGSQTAPAYPLVVGQDPDKRGADFSFSASVQPTIYITYVQVPIIECVASSGGGGGGCGPGEKAEVVGYQCVENRETFEECIDSAGARLRLTADSRAWILEELSIRYPEAYLHQPEFRFSSGGGCAWNGEESRVPLADPGYWELFVSGRTSGTPVSAPRGFGGQVDRFGVWMKETAIIR